MRQKYKIMTFKILRQRDFSCKLKATVQQSGKLNFTESTSTVLGLTDRTYIKFATDDENDMYMIIVAEAEADSFRVCKSGRYFYIPARMIFDAQGIDYINKAVIFDLQRRSEFDEELRGSVYRMNRRENIRKRKEDVQ